MKKRWMGILLAVLLMFSAGPIVYAGLDLEGEFNYEIDEAATDGYTQVAVNSDREPFDFSLTWRRDWVPVQQDSLSVDGGISLGYLRLGYERELLEFDVGIASLTLTIDPFTFGYARILDGEDPGTFTLRFEKFF